MKLNIVGGKMIKLIKKIKKLITIKDTAYKVKISIKHWNEFKKDISEANYWSNDEEMLYRTFYLSGFLDGRMVGIEEEK